MKKKLPQQKNIAIAKRTKTKAKTFPFVFLSVLFILLHLFLSFGPEVERGWGVNYIRFFEPALICFFYSILIIVCLPPINKLLVDFFTTVSRKKIVAMARKYKLLLFAMMAVGAGFAFHALQVKYVFLGDMDLRVKQIEKGEFLRDEYLAMYMLKLICTGMSQIGEYTCMQVVVLFSNVAGALFLFISLLIADAIGKNVLQKIAFFTISALSIGALMQFCGYVEIYTSALLVLQLYLYLSVLHLQRKINIIFPVLALLLAIGTHLMMISLLPSLFFLFYRNVLWKHPFFRKKTTFYLLAAVAVPFLYYAITHFGLSKMLPFVPGEKGFMTMFSVAHYKEFINSQLLGGGLVFIIWAAVLLFYAFHKIKFTAFHWFYTLSSLSITGLLFVFIALRGSGDWDILSFGAVVNNAATAFLLLDLHRRGIVKNIKYGICVMAFFAVMHSSFWIATNASDKSIGWVEKAFEKDPAGYYKGSFSNESMLGAVFSANNLTEKSLYWEKTAYLRHQEDPRTGFNYANVLIKAGRSEEAIQIYETSVTRFPAYPLPYAQLVNIYLNNKNYEALYRLLLKMETTYQNNPGAFTSRFSQEQIDSYFELLKQLQPMFLSSMANH
jgi:hypothetical protein